MKKLIFVWVCVLSGLCFAQENETVESKVVAATIFKDRAMVTRKAEKELTKGIHTLVFSNLTTDLQNESVRVAAQGAGEIKILDVKVEKRFTTEIRGDEIRSHQKKIDDLKLDLQIASDNISVLENKKDFINSLKAEALKYANQKILLSTSSTNKWANMLSFVESNLSEIYNGLRIQNLKKSKINREIKALQMTIKQFRGGKSQNFKEIVVKVQNNQSGKIALQPSYLVQNSSWYPVYDIRVNSKQKEAEISYFGMIQQSTGEDWDDIKLTFSTAQPLSVKALPKLESWFVDTKPLPVRRVRPKKNNRTRGGFPINYDQNWGLPAGKGTISGYVTDKMTGEPLPGVNLAVRNTLMGSSSDANGKFLITNVPKGNYVLDCKYVGFQEVNIDLEVLEKHSANLVVELNESMLESEEIVVIAERPLIEKHVYSSSVVIEDIDELRKSKSKPSYSNIYALELSTVFELPVKNTVPSDNSPHKVTIAIDDFPIDFEYTSIPKMISKVYLKGKITNNKNYPLLEGSINIFVDEDFVNKTYSNTVVYSDTLELSLGIDESMRIERKLLNKYAETIGFLESTKRITYEYEIQITNNRKTEESIWLYDQLPITMNERIKISLLNPVIENELLSSDKILDWHLNLKPGEIKKVRIKYQIEHPKNQSVYGLE